MTKQGPRYRGGETSLQPRLHTKIKRVGLLAVASIGMLAGIGSWMAASGHDTFTLFTLGVGDQGSMTASWAPGTDVRTTSLEDLKQCAKCRVEILVPEKYADAIRRTFEQIEDPENVDPPKLLRMIVVIGGSAASVCDNHWHGNIIYHNHCN